MKLYDLAKRIANFIWDFDPYNAKDYYSSFGDAVSETLIGLSNRTQREAIKEFLCDIAIQEDYEPEMALSLAREVSSLC